MIEFISLLFAGAWELYSLPFPGFSFSIGSVLLAGLLAVFALRLLGNLTGFNFHSTINSVSGGNNRRIKISSARKGDEH